VAISERFVRGLLGGGPIYVRIRAKELYVRDVASGREWRGVPEVAIKTTAEHTIVAVGSDAAIASAQDQETIEVVNPFRHPRSLISNFLVAEKLLQHALHKIFEGRWMRPAPVILMHPLEQLDGGLTQVERRAFLELGAGAGARLVHLWVGRELEDREVGEQKFTIAP